MSSMIEKIASIFHRFIWHAKYPVPTSQRLRTMLDYFSLHRSKGITRSEYLDFEFERQTDVFRKSFLGLYEQQYYLDVLNPVRYFTLARNKYLTHRVLEHTGVRKAILYCYYQPTSIICQSDEIASSFQDVFRILTLKKVSSCVIKTTESSHGDNVFVIKALEYLPDDIVLRRFDGTAIMLSEILSNDSLIFESIIQQTEQFKQFNASSVNTVRFMTTLYPDNQAKIFAVFLKVGRKGNCVDNAGSGGNVDAAVDIESGRIYNVVQFDGYRKRKKIDHHPDSGAQLENCFIDKWEQIKADVIRFQQAFPYCKAAGWDIAITDDGPVVVEINDFWDRTGQLFIGKGWREEIRDCYMAWKSTGVDYTIYRQFPNLSRKRLNHIIQKEF